MQIKARQRNLYLLPCKDLCNNQVIWSLIAEASSIKTPNKDENWSGDFNSKQFEEAKWKWAITYTRAEEKIYMQVV